MIMKILYLDNEIKFDNDSVNVMEIENKKIFYRFIKELNNIYFNNTDDNILIFDNKKNEINFNKFKMIFDFFNFDFNSKKYLGDVSKTISNSMDSNVKDSMVNEYNKFGEKFFKSLNDIDLPITTDYETSYDCLLKQFNIKLNYNDDLISNLFLLIDLNNQLNLNDIIVFVNLKQYLTNLELEELYKYSMIKQVNILLVDSQAYGCTLKYEKKLIIDANLDEFVL